VSVPVVVFFTVVSFFVSVFFSSQKLVFHDEVYLESILGIILSSTHVLFFSDLILSATKSNLSFLGSSITGI